MIPVNMPIKDIRASVAVIVTYVSHDTSGPMFEMLQIILNETPKHSRFTTIANVILIINFWDLTDHKDAFGNNPVLALWNNGRR